MICSGVLYWEVNGMNNTINFVGWDPGRMYDKIESLSNGKFIEASSMNAVCRGYDRRVLEEENESTINYLDVNIYEEDIDLGRFFVGNMAFKENQNDLITTSNGMEKYSKSLILYDKVRMLSHIAYSHYESEVKTNSDVRTIIGTGVPTEEFFDEKNAERLKSITEALSSRYKVVFNHKRFNRYEVNIDVEKVNFFPEGTASAQSTKETVNEDLEVVKNSELIDKLGNNYLTLNLGSSTGDGAVLKDGKFVPTGFLGVPIGSSTALDHIINDLYMQSGYKPNKLMMDFLLMSNPKISYKDIEYNIEAISKIRYGDLIAQIKISLLNELDRRNVDFKRLTAVYLTGGLVETLKQIDRNILEDLLPIKVVISKRPIFDEAMGYMISAIKNYKKAQLTSEKVYAVESVAVSSDVTKVV